MQSAARESNYNTRFMLIGLVCSFAFAFAIRMSHFENEPITDELYILLAAESWATDGTFHIAEGEYRRARAFTAMIGIVHRLSNGNLNAIRVFCITLGSLLVGVMFVFTAMYAGRVAAVVGSLLLAINPTAIFLSQYIRFYGLHALLFFLLAWSFWSLFRGTWSSRKWWLVAAICALSILAIHLQITTLVGMAGIGLWLAFIYRRMILSTMPGAARKIMVAAALAIVVGAVLYFFHGTIFALLDTYRESALWNSSDNAFYYFNTYRDDLGVLWSLAPAAFVVATLARPAPALFCTFIFITAFVLQSFGGMRSERFMFYALPWFFIVWGIASQVFEEALKNTLNTRLLDTQLLRGNNKREVLASCFSNSVIALIAMFALLTVPAFETFAKMTLGKPSSPAQYWDRYRTNWKQASQVLKPLAADVAVTVASQPLHAIYYLDKTQFALNATILADIAAVGEHSRLDPRTGQLVFDDTDTMKRIVACYPSGLLILHKPAWRNPTRIGDDVADYIEKNLENLPMPASFDMMVFRWLSPIGANSNCPP